MSDFTKLRRVQYNHGEIAKADAVNRLVDAVEEMRGQGAEVIEVFGAVAQDLQGQIEVVGALVDSLVGFTGFDQALVDALDGGPEPTIVFEPEQPSGDCDCWLCTPANDEDKSEDPACACGAGPASECSCEGPSSDLPDPGVGITFLQSFVSDADQPMADRLAMAQLLAQYGY